MKLRSRNRPKEINDYEIECPYCGCKWTDDTEEDYYSYLHTKIHYCRKCGLEFVNGVTKSIEYKYS